MGLLSKSVFVSEMKNIEYAFGKTMPKEQLAIYFRYIEGKFTDETFPKACDAIIKQERFFPTVSVFLERGQKPMGGLAF